jgi:phosphate ABC transporter permease protein PstC
LTVLRGGSKVIAPDWSLRFLSPGWEESRREALARFAFFLLLIAGLATLFVVVLMVAREAYPALSESSGLLGLLIAEPWEPLSEPARLGLRHAWISTLAVTAIALALAVPLGFGIAIFIAEIAPATVRKVLQPCIELLAGIPSVVYGFFGYVTLVPWFESVFEMAAGESLLAAGLILAVMILPFVASTSAEALAAVPGDVREAALALGANRCCVTWRVLVRHAAPGLFAAVALGLARALGETLAVLMLAGNSVAVPFSPLDRGQPITALIITELGEAGIGSPKQHALFAAALVLMVVIVVVNAIIGLIKRRMLHDRA